MLLTGYNTDMCVCSTTAGYKNLSQDFDVFLVGDATIATFPAQPTPRFATTSSVCFAALNLFITQVSWVRPVPVRGRPLMRGEVDDASADGSSHDAARVPGLGPIHGPGDGGPSRAFAAAPRPPTRP